MSKSKTPLVQSSAQSDPIRDEALVEKVARKFANVVWPMDDMDTWEFSYCPRDRLLEVARAVLVIISPSSTVDIARADEVESSAAYLEELAKFYPNSYLGTGLLMGAERLRTRAADKKEGIGP